MHYLPLQNVPRFVCARTRDAAFAPCFITYRFHLALHVYPGNTQVTSKRGKNKEVRYEPQASSVTDVLCVIRVHTHGKMESIFFKYKFDSGYPAQFGNVF